MTTGSDQPHQHLGSDVPKNGDSSTGPMRAAGEAIIHAVRASENLFQIAATYGVDVSEITAANNLTEHSLIYPGLRLVIPSSPSPDEFSKRTFEFHQVRPGETLYSISQMCEISVTKLQQLNSLSDNAIVFPGTTLRLTEPEVQETIDAPVQLARRAPTACLVHGYHRVKFGDQVSRIASLHGVSTQALLSANSLGWNDAIHEGQKLIVPISHGPYDCPNLVHLEPGQIHTANTYFDKAQNLNMSDFSLVVAFCLEMQRSGMIPSFGSLRASNELLPIIAQIPELETLSVKQAIAAAGFEDLASGSALWEPSAWKWLREVKSK